MFEPEPLEGGFYYSTVSASPERAQAQRVRIATPCQPVCNAAKCTPLEPKHTITSLRDGDKNTAVTGGTSKVQGHQETRGSHQPGLTI